MLSVTRALMAMVLVGAWAMPAAAQDAKVAAGQLLFTAQKCSLCHAVAGVGNKKHPLDGVAKTITAEMAALWLTDPKAAAAKTRETGTPPMKSFAGLSAEDRSALVAYVMSLK